MRISNFTFKIQSSGASGSSKLSRTAVSRDAPHLFDVVVCAQVSAGTEQLKRFDQTLIKKSYRCTSAHDAAAPAPCCLFCFRFALAESAQQVAHFR